MTIRSSRTRTLAFGLCLAALLSGCRGGRPPAAHDTQQTAPLRKTSAPAAPAGPLKGTRWDPAKLRTGTLLHDDGRRLWAQSLNGRPTVVWTHPKAEVYELSAAPGGRQVALSVNLSRLSAGAISSVLYLLDADGSVRTVDAVRNFGQIQSPVFLQAPNEAHGPVRLYWLRTSEDTNPRTGRFRNQVMVLDGRSPRPVRLALRYDESPVAIFGYPGSRVLAVMLYRDDNVPTRFEVLRNTDYSYLPSTSLTYWTQFISAANTDDPAGVAWLSPLDYALIVGKTGYRQSFGLRLLRTTCEYFGSHKVGFDGIDYGQSGYPWPLLAAGPAHVLVLRARDLAAIRARRATSAPWISVDVRTGAGRETRVRWRPGPWWTFVAPRRPTHLPQSPRESDCRRYSWTYP